MTQCCVPPESNFLLAEESTQVEDLLHDEGIREDSGLTLKGRAQGSREREAAARSMVHEACSAVTRW